MCLKNVSYLLFVCLVFRISGIIADANDCNEYERSCLADGKCIPETWWCDAHSLGPDCSDGADETKCSASDCASTNTFHCGKSMTCTPIYTRCNGESDCPDNEDEANCKDYKCLDGTVKCKDNTCALGDKCDGTEDCSDGEDEENCEEYKCPWGKIKCEDHSCVLGEQCNGLTDCNDGSDEHNCQEYECPLQKMKCNDHTCVWGERCNSWIDCKDGSDEENCEASDCAATYMFHCGKSMTCTPIYNRCDGVSNCPDNEDEANCKEYECLYGSVKCKDDTCAQGDRCDV
ncbi:uncharacterized protein LOC143069849 [Mytilus galloprovincialis]|uniref:uncharacterized protein LOC143069849 n=1 Tax=Mytilus galloprovincialis TaxID=29158 RepID=UPI003F7BF9F5